MEIWRYLRTSFSGLSTEVWWLAVITFVNRAGTMVIPFLSLYLTRSLDFSLSDVGWVMSSFGLGSVVGTWLGGNLSDRFGNYPVMKYSLIGTGILFILLQFIQTFWMWCLSIFMIMIIADALRPAIFVALNAYCRPENRTRSVTLIRLAINLGFVAGPAVGGWIIMVVGYSGLFWVDGITCLLAVVVLVKVLNPKRARQSEVEVPENPVSAYRDGLYWLFFIGLFLFTLAFLQYFSTLPLYYKEVHTLNESQIGMLLGLSGLIIFLFEMPMMKWLEGQTRHMLHYVIIGAVFLSMSFFVLNWFSWSGVLILGIILMTVGEMLVFPFSHTFAMKRGERGLQGEYLAMYSLAFSTANIFGHNLGMQSLDRYGYNATWYITAGIVLASGLLFYQVLRILRNSRT